MTFGLGIFTLDCKLLIRERLKQFDMVDTNYERSIKKHD